MADPVVVSREQSILQQFKAWLEAQQQRHLSQRGNDRQWTPAQQQHRDLALELGFAIKELVRLEHEVPTHNTLSAGEQALDLLEKLVKMDDTYYTSDFHPVLSALQEARAILRLAGRKVE